MKELKKGNTETFRFTSINNIDGDFTFGTQGFGFNKQVGQEKLIEIPFATTIEVDCMQDNIFTITLTDDCTITLKNAVPGAYTFIMKQDSTGGRAVTFPTSTLVESALGAPALGDSAANQIDIVGILYDGTDYYLNVTSNFVAISTL